MKVENLSFSFKKNKIFENISFDIQQNEVTAILGVSGSGKSTLIKLLAGLYKPEQGRVLHEKKDDDSYDSKSVIFQDSTLFPWKTVRENIELASMGKVINISEIAREVGLYNALDYYPNQLSGGMKQRAEFARVLAKSPKILFMDEPFSKLDVQFRKHLQDVFLKIHKTTKTTTIFVTHDIKEAIKVASNIKILLGSPVSKVIEYNINDHSILDLLEKVEVILKEDFEKQIQKIYGGTT